MKNTIILFLSLLFVSCAKEPTLTNTWLGDQLIGNSYVVHNRTTNTAEYEWSFENEVIYERKLVNNSYYGHSSVKRGEWGIIYKLEYTVGIWVETPEIGYKEFDFDFSGKDIIFKEKLNETNRYFCEFVDW